MRLLVCGDREWANQHLMDEVLECLFAHDIDIVIHGNARGADQMAGRVADRYGVHTAVVKALWDYYHKPAGPIRNRVMLGLEPELVVAFHNNIEESRGTADMLTIAEEAGVEYFLVEEELKGEENGDD